MVDLMVQTVDTPLHATLSVLVSNPTWNNTLCDSQIVFMSLGVHCVRLMYVCEVPRNTGYIPNTRITF